jgi:glyoxylase-like metal-dependent hydrolase (beta-lactamase superfamily II)
VANALKVTVPEWGELPFFCHHWFALPQNVAWFTLSPQISPLEQETIMYGTLQKVSIAGLGALALVFLQACSGESAVPAAPVTTAAPSAEQGPPAAELAQALFAAMGGQALLEDARILVQTGSGIRNHLGQIQVAGGPDPKATLDPLEEIIDLQNGHAAFRNTVLIEGGFAQSRTEVSTSYMGQRLGWGTTGGRANIVTSMNGLFSWSTHNSPEFLVRRNPIAVALSAGSATGRATEASLEGESHWYLRTTLGNEQIGLYIDKDSGLLRGFTALDTESMRGDQQATYIYGDYRPVGSLQLPHRVEIRHGDGLFASIQYSNISLDDPAALAIFEIPEDVIDQAELVLTRQGQSWVPLEWVEVAPGVAHIVAFSHNSMVVEFPRFVVVVEGPYTEGQSLTLSRMITERTGKPIRYVVPTHPHHDHTGGLRGLASVGAAVLTARGHEAEIRGIVESARTNPPDALARNIAAGAEVGHVEIFNGTTDIVDGDQQLWLYEVKTIPHVNPMVLAYVPSSKVLFQSDLFFGGGGPDAQALYEAINLLGLDVEQIVGGHGGVLPFATLEMAASGSN